MQRYTAVWLFLFLLLQLNIGAVLHAPWPVDIILTPLCYGQTPPLAGRGSTEKAELSVARRLRAEGEALQKKGQLQAAIEKYEESQKYYADGKMADHTRALREALSKQYMEAAKKLRAEGEAFQKKGNMQGALEKYQMAQKYYPDPKLADHILALQKATRKPKLDLEGPAEGFREELALLDKIRKDPNSGNIDALAEMRYQYALTLTQTGLRKKDGDSLKLAFQYAQSATALSSDNGNYWALLGQLYDALGDDPLNEIMAEDALQRAVELSPDDVRKRLLLAQFYFSHNNHPAALEQFEAAMKKNPIFLSVPIASAMCTSYVLARQSAKGVAFFKEMIGKQPNPDTSRLALAILLHENKESSRAMEELVKIINRKESSAENRDYALLLLDDWKKEGVRP
jgi:lipopolysaccharide biosynthesis regulator YciM